MSDLAARIDAWYDGREGLSEESDEARRDVELVLTKLDDGQLRVAEVVDVAVVVHEWLKKAVALTFRLSGLTRHDVGPFEYVDRLALKHDLSLIHI